MGGTICDLTKAFYCVNHELLLSNLKFYGVKGLILEWLKSYLNNRKQRVDLEFIKTRCYSSGWGAFTFGVPRAVLCDPCCLIYTLMIFKK
jgi:hypothetical protein